MLHDVRLFPAEGGFKGRVTCRLPFSPGSQESMPSRQRRRESLFSGRAGGNILPDAPPEDGENSGKIRQGHDHASFMLKCSDAQ